MKRVAVASQNPVKVNVARLAFKKMFPNLQFEFTSVDVDSGVSDQPKTDEETLTGARNRVANTIIKEPNADYYVGMEGGIEVLAGDMYSFAWIVVSDKERIGKSKGACFQLPPKIKGLIESGMELGDADTVVFGVENSKQKMGAVGLLTNGVIDRTNLYLTPAVFALLPFMQEDLY